MKITIIIILLIFTIRCFSQENEDLGYSNSIRINILSLPFKEISVFADKKMRNDYFAELVLGYQFSSISIGNNFLFFSDNDPFWYYTRLKCGLGVNHFLSKNFYLGISYRLKYLFFDKQLFKKYVDAKGEIADEDWVISRQKYEIGLYIKLAYVKQLTKNFIFDFFIGIGVKSVHSFQKVWSKEGYNGLIQDTYPISTKSNEIKSDIFVGVSIGICN